MQNSFLLCDTIDWHHTNNRWPCRLIKRLTGFKQHVNPSGVILCLVAKGIVFITVTKSQSVIETFRQNLYLCSTLYFQIYSTVQENWPRTDVWQISPVLIEWSSMCIQKEPRFYSKNTIRSLFPHLCWVSLFRFFVISRYHCYFFFISFSLFPLSFPFFFFFCCLLEFFFVEESCILFSLYVVTVDINISIIKGSPILRIPLSLSLSLSHTHTHTHTINPYRLSPLVSSLDSSQCPPQIWNQR